MTAGDLEILPVPNIPSLKIATFNINTDRYGVLGRQAIVVEPPAAVSAVQVVPLGQLL